MKKKKSKKRRHVSKTRVVVRFRPKIKEELKFGVIEGVPLDPTNANDIDLKAIVSNRPKKWSFGKFFKVFTQSEKNVRVFENSLLDLLQPTKKRGYHFGTICVLCYGHSGSGKSHTTLGYRGESGLLRLTVNYLCNLVREAGDEKVFLRLTFCEIHNDRVFDLLNKRHECAVRADSNGDMLIRSTVVVKKVASNSIWHKERKIVVIRPLTYAKISEIEDMDEVLKYGIKMRAVGCSTTHSESSRSHAIISVELVTEDLLKIRAERAEYETELANAETDHLCRKWRAKVQNMRELESSLLTKYRENNEIVGSEINFIDLAGSDYDSSNSKMNDHERKEFKQINVSLLALKECIRAINMKKSHVPFRNSQLTKLLKRTLLAKNCRVLLVGNISPCDEQTIATVNTLKYVKLIANSNK